MTDRFVIVHTDERGNIETLAVVAYTDLAEAERRVAERRRTATEHGWSDAYEAFRLVPVDALSEVEQLRQDVERMAQHARDEHAQGWKEAIGYLYGMSAGSSDDQETLTLWQAAEKLTACAKELREAAG
ncbi:hypothetical protein GCM10010399_63700 [Dactylosporangium fulvum]|uniref:Ead/Ea22-like family protein n=1 Tax=Dactylosporangium fulvum TaxID=53359 RepID=A0ABY5W6U3_9ACTN|nr:hypothetical protein [Dactylosporangium fulvum]UWP85807.1 hypothetical protein Dfulv_16805 [Dactylosporangium fulvum]